MHRSCLAATAGFRLRCGLEDMVNSSGGVSDQTGRHIAIVGEMGVGKTAVGTLLAQALGRPFHDSDRALQLTQGRSAAEIAATESVSALHDLELEMFLSASRSAEPSVVSPASSVVDDARGRAALAKAIVVWLRATGEVVKERRSTGDHRRALTPFGHEELRTRRERLFADLADMVVDTSELGPSEVVDVIADWLGEHGVSE